MYVLGRVTHKGIPMPFEDIDLGLRLPRRGVSRRVLDGIVQGRPDCWVVVAREERDLEEWLQFEEQAVEAVPLRICTAVLENGDLILDDSQNDPADLLDWAELS